MDPDFHKRMFEEGGTLVLLGMPPGTEFGIDLSSWNVGEKFKGVKMIPPGVHFIYFSAVSKDGQTAPRTGFFHSFSAKDLVVKHYNQIDEDISDENEADQIERIRGDLYNLDKNLGPYPFELWSKWVSLTQYIDLKQLERMQPLSGKICSATDLVNADPYTRESCINVDNGDMGDEVKSSGGGNKLLTLPEMHPRPGTELRLSCIPKKAYKEGASPSDVTKYSMDSSYILQNIFDNHESPDSLIAEVQFSFICFLVGQMWDGWEHWKEIIPVMCKAEEYLVDHPDIYIKIISILHFQIHEVPEDLFVDIVEGNNFLASALSYLFANVSDNALKLPQELVSKTRKFKMHLRQKFKWDLTLETDDDAPVVVAV